MKHSTRFALLTTSCVLATNVGAQLVINEVDYDQPGTDNAEYIEILNTGPSPLDLSNLNVMMHNGASGNAVEYASLSGGAWPVLAAGSFFVICANASTANCNAVVTPATNLIQNGPMDAIALVWTENPTPLVMDVLSYAGTLPGEVEGTGTTNEDTNLGVGVSLGRFPDGTDTQDNSADFHRMCSTPGAPNVIDPLVCGLDVSVMDVGAASSTFTVLPSPDGHGMLVFDANEAAEPLAFDLFSADGALLASRSASAAPRFSWHLDASRLRGRMLLVRLTTPTRREIRRVVLP